MPRLPANVRERAIGMLQAGMSQRNVAAALNSTRLTINRLRRRLQQTGNTADRPRSGRPRVTTRAQDRFIRTSHLRDRFRPATRTARHLRIGPATVRRRLRERDIRARRPYNGPILTPRHRQARLQWARTHQRWLIRRWDSVVFSDESRFCLQMADGRVRVYRRRNERFADVCVRQVDRFRGGSVMVWGGITSNNRTRLIVINGNLNAQRYRDEVLAPVLVPFLNAHGPGLTFQQDNARSHSARLTQAYLQANNVNVLPWPALSPDLSPIEHVWDVLGRRVRDRPVQPRTLRELQNAILQEWGRIPQAVMRRHITSMRRRCTAVINNNGGHTRY